jgi:peroxiredoxin
MKNQKLQTRNGMELVSSLCKKSFLILIYFTEQNTPSCTKQLLSFKEEIETLKQYPVQVFAVSVDEFTDLILFEKKLNGLPFEIASDVNGSLAKKIGVFDNDLQKTNRSIIILNQLCEVIYLNPFYQPDNINDFTAVFSFLEKMKLITE